jgi:hypothetical protein
MIPSFLNPQGLTYSVIDLRLNGGLGDVVSGMKNLNVPGALWTGMMLDGTRHHNNRDAWITTREYWNSNHYLTYLVDPSGVSNTPVVSNSFFTLTYPYNYENYMVMIRFSPDGSRMVGMYRDTLEYCLFNDQTGQITPLFRVSMHGPFSPYEPCAEFSVNSKYLYISYDPGLHSGKIYQFDATLTDSAQFMQSKTQIGAYSRPNLEWDSWIRRGPDNKIYCSEISNDSISVINYPNNPGLACNYQRFAVPLSGNYIYGGFPHFLERYYVYMNPVGNCKGMPVVFTPAIWPPADSVRWDFGDPASGLLNHSTIANATHIYNNPGTYNLELYVRHIDNRTDTARRTIMILDNHMPVLGPNRIVCEGDSVILDAGSCSGCTYSWDNLLTSQYDIGNGQTYTVKTMGIYRATVTSPNGCAGQDTIILSFSPPPQLTNDTLYDTICSGQTTNIVLISDNPSAGFHWTATLTSGSITGFSADSGAVIHQTLVNPSANPGIVTYHITPKIGSCSGTTVDFPVTVVAGDSVKVTILPSTTNLCQGDQITFTATPTNPGSSPVYQWYLGSTPVGTNSTTYTFTPNNGDLVSCTLTSSLTVCISNNPASSTPYPISVSPLAPVSITLTASPPVICAGTSVTFSAHPVNGGSAPSYQWKVNGVNVGPNSDTYSFIPVNGDLVSCTLSSSEPCATNNPASSIQYPISVTAIQPVSVTISTPTNPFCLGSSVTFTATPTNGGVPGYQWKVNGINVGANSSTYTYIPAGGDIVSCIMNSSLPCTTVVIQPLPIPSR